MPPSLAKGRGARKASWGSAPRVDDLQERGDHLCRSPCHRVSVPQMI